MSDMNAITLKEVIVKGLFGRYDYHLDFDNGHNISILIGPNGSGKTTIFNLIDFIVVPMRNKLDKIKDIPFESCECVFANGGSIRLESKKIKSSDYLSVYLKDKDLQQVLMNLDDDVRKQVEQRIFNKQYGRELTFVLPSSNVRIPVYSLFDEKISEVKGSALSPIVFGSREKSETMRRLLRYFDTSSKKSNKKNNSTTVLDYWLKSEVDYIRADRLHQQEFQHFYDKDRDFESHTEQNVMQDIQNYFRRYITETRNRYTLAQDTARDKLPQAYLNTDKPLMKYSVFQEQWKQYVEAMNRYYEIGLLDSSNSAKSLVGISDLLASYDKKGAFLTVYLDAFQETLKPLESRYQPLKLFIDILNDRNRVTGKRFRFCDDGIMVQVGKNVLSLDDLSSGEKNDFIMFFDLIFMTSSDAIVLIDEPEISLHIAWQEDFLNRVIEICKLNGLQVIIATHSPNIIAGHLDLYAKRGLFNERSRN